MTRVHTQYDPSYRGDTYSESRTDPSRAEYFRDHPNATTTIAERDARDRARLERHRATAVEQARALGLIGRR